MVLWRGVIEFGIYLSIAFREYRYLFASDPFFQFIQILFHVFIH